jgi:hypothetical protein
MTTARGNDFKAPKENTAIILNGIKRDKPDKYIELPIKRKTDFLNDMNFHSHLNLFIHTSFAKQYESDY